MFKNKALSIQLVQKPSDGSAPDTNPAKIVDIDEITQILMYHAPHAAKIVVSAVVAKKLLDTGCEIALMYASHKLK
jgi:hypothetical protein